MPLTFLAVFLEFPRTPTAMCAAGLALFFTALVAAKTDIASARGLEKIVALVNLCFAIPLAVFGALHLFAPQSLLPLVPRYMPARMFIVYFVGFALIAAALSIATKVAVRWSGLLFGIMMFSFVSMLMLPGALRQPGRIIWTIVFRESSFGAGGLLLAAMAKDGWSEKTKSALIIIGRILVAATTIVFGVEHFLHPLGLPGVPLEKEMPAWVPLRPLIDYVTGAALLAVSGSIILNRKTRTVAACVGGWILLTLLVIYIPVMIGALYNPVIDVKIEGINYFADTLLFVGVILALANASPQSD
jgi:uncharacterized membrane protein